MGALDSIDTILKNFCTSVSNTTSSLRVSQSGDAAEGAGRQANGTPKPGRQRADQNQYGRGESIRQGQDIIKFACWQCV